LEPVRYSQWNWSYVTRGAACFALGFLAVGWLTGCGENDTRVDVYPVKGKVLVGGQPAEGAQVVFYPQSPELQGPGMPVPEGTTDSDGQFELQSFDPADGAPAGDFNVTVSWPEPTPENFSGIIDPKDRLGGRYVDPQRSGLTVTVEKGGGELPPLELK
jgi:hypothetical protein